MRELSNLRVETEGVFRALPEEVQRVPLTGIQGSMTETTEKNNYCQPSVGVWHFQEQLLH